MKDKLRACHEILVGVINLAPDMTGMIRLELACIDELRRWIGLRPALQRDVPIERFSVAQVSSDMEKFARSLYRRKASIPRVQHTAIQKWKSPDPLRVKSL